MIGKNILPKKQLYVNIYGLLTKRKADAFLCTRLIGISFISLSLFFPSKSLLQNRIALLSKDSAHKIILEFPTAVRVDTCCPFSPFRSSVFPTLNSLIG